MLLEREVEMQYRPRMREALQDKVTAVADSLRGQTPVCSRCGQTMKRHDIETVSWLARFGRLRAAVARYRCPACKDERRPLLELLGVEPGRISGSLARLLALLAVVAPYPLAAQLAWLLLGVKISPMGVWKVAQRLGEPAARYSEGLSQYHADSRSEGASTREAPPAVVLSVDGSMLGMQVRKQRRRRQEGKTLPPLPPVKEGQFQEVKTGVLLLPSQRVETSPGRHSVVRRFLVSCLGNADTIFARLYAQVRELGWVGPDTVVVIVGDGAEWIWNRATMFVRRCEILDFWHVLEHAWGFARLHYGEGSKQAGRWVHRIATDLRAGKVDDVIARLKRLRPKTPEAREKLQRLIAYYSAHAGRMRYDEDLRLYFPEFREKLMAFDARLLGYPWSHPDPRVDRLQLDLQALVARCEQQGLPRREVFAAVWHMAHEAAERPAPMLAGNLGSPIPRLSEPWYCCAEPTDQQLLSF